MGCCPSDDNGYLLFGFVTALSAETITVDDFTHGEVTALIDSTFTTIVNEITVGGLAIVIAADLGSGPVAFSILSPVDENGFYTLSGQVIALTDTSISVDDQELVITVDTEVVGSLEIGSLVSVVALAADFRLTAVSITVIEPQTTVWGVITDLSPTSATIGGEVFNIGPATIIEGELEIGAVAIAVGNPLPDGANEAVLIAVVFEAGGEQPILLIGEVEAIGETSLTVSGIEFTITPDTQFNSTVVQGDFVVIMALPDGAGGYIALSVDRFWGMGDQATYVGVVTDVTASSLIVDDLEFRLTPDTIIDEPLMVGDEVWVLFEIQADESLVAIEVVRLAGESVVVGAVNAMSSNSITVDGTPIALNGRTVMSSAVQVGDTVKVTVSGAARQANGLTALYVTPAAPTVPTAVTLAGTAAQMSTPVWAPVAGALLLALLTATLVTTGRRAHG